MTADVPEDLVHQLRRICSGLPDAREEAAWTGVRWRIGTKTFAHLVHISDGWPPAYAKAARSDGPTTVLTFRAGGADLHALAHAGPPFFKPVWFPDIVGVVVDERTDWGAIAELVQDSYRHLAPRRLSRRD